LISDPRLIVISLGLLTSDDETIRLSGCDINSRFTPQKDSGKSQLPGGGLKVYPLWTFWMYRQGQKH